jgi:hypothetical protein
MMRWQLTWLWYLVTVSTGTGKDLVVSGFDGELKAGHDRVWQGNGVSMVRGLNRRALHCTGGGFVMLADDVGFKSEEGTIDFWVRTDWDGNDGLAHNICALGKESGVRLAKLPDNQLTLVWQPMRGKSPLRFGFDISKDWPARQWRYVAVTWKKNTYSIYVDGEKRSSVEPDQPMAALQDTRPLVIGGPKSMSADMAVDLFMLRDRALSDADVVERYARGMSVLELEDDPRLVMRALVGSRPATLVMDTGSSVNALWHSFAEQAGIKALPSYRGGKLFKEEAKVTLTLPKGAEFTQDFAILDSPVVEDGWQGLVGWPNFFEANRLRVVWERRTIIPVGAEAVKSLGDDWLPLLVTPGTGVLTLPATKVSINDTELTLPVVVDTGEGAGLSLTSDTWRRLMTDWADDSRGYLLRWTPSGGVQPRVAVVAKDVRLFGHTLKSVSVEEDSHSPHTGEGEKLRVGLSALSFFEVLIDGVESRLWLKPRAKAAVRGGINPSGLLAVPGADKITLLVPEGSLAWKHGLRTDDEIVQWEQVPMKSGDLGMEMHADIRRLLNAGQAVTLKVRRGNETMEIRAAEK